MARIIIQPEADEHIKSLVGLALENQMRMLKSGISKTKSKLQKYENENNMDTKAFYDKYNKGELGDDIDFIKWAGEYETLIRLEKDQKALQETELCS